MKNRMVFFRATQEDFTILNFLQESLTRDSQEGIIYTRTDVFRAAIRALAARKKETPAHEKEKTKTTGAP